MKKTILTMAVCAFMTATISTSFGQDTAKESIKANVKTQETPKDTNSELQKFKKESGIKIKNIDNYIGNLKVYFYQNKIKNKEAFQDNLNLLEQKNDNLNVKLTDYKDEEQSKLASFKTELNRDLAEIAKAVDGFIANNK